MCSVHSSRCGLVWLWVSVCQVLLFGGVGDDGRCLKDIHCLELAEFRWVGTLTQSQASRQMHCTGVCVCVCLCLCLCESGGR